MKKKAPLKLNIKGIDWTFLVQTDRVYSKAHGKDSAGITYPGDKAVFFNSSYFCWNYVVHELLHVYYASCLTNSSNLDAEGAEDNCCEILGEHYFEIGANANKILTYFMV